jgi:hypothetical protein
MEPDQRSHPWLTRLILWGAAGFGVPLAISGEIVGLLSYSMEHAHMEMYLLSALSIIAAVGVGSATETRTLRSGRGGWKSVLARGWLAGRLLHPTSGHSSQAVASQNLPGRLMYLPPRE